MIELMKTIPTVLIRVEDGVADVIMSSGPVNVVIEDLDTDQRATYTYDPNTNSIGLDSCESMLDDDEDDETEVM